MLALPPRYSAQLWLQLAKRIRLRQDPVGARGALESMGLDYEALQQIPIVMIHGRGRFATAGGQRVYPEQIKEGIYHDPELARLSTANFRLASGQSRARLRIQLSPGVEPRDTLNAAFAEAISHYATCPLDVTCEPYGSFGSGMSLDYERKFDYLGP